MTTLKAPTLTQWQKLCEMAGFPFECDTPYGLAYRFSDGEQAQVMSVGLIPHNTDALMRLMDALSTSMWSPIFERWRDESRSLMMKLESPKKMFEHYDNEYRDPVEAFQAAACDILAQLAEAEGIQ